MNAKTLSKPSIYFQSVRFLTDYKSLTIVNLNMVFFLKSRYLRLIENENPTFAEMRCTCLFIYSNEKSRALLFVSLRGGLPLHSNSIWNYSFLLKFI